MSKAADTTRKNIREDTSAGRRKRLSGNVLYYVNAFSLTVILVILVSGIYLCWYYYQNTKRSFYENNSLYLGNVVRTHENELQILKDIAIQINLSEDGRFLLDEKPIKNIALRSQINQYRSVNHFFDVMYYYYQKDHYLFNHTTSTDLDSFCTKGYQLEHCTGEELKSLLTQPRKTTAVIPEGRISGDQFHFYSIRGSGAVYIMPVAPTYDCLLVFFIGSDSIDLIFGGDGSEQRNTYLLFENTLVASRETEEIPEENLAAILVPQEDKEDAQEQIRLGRESYVLTRMKGDSGFSYLSLQRMSVFADNLRSHAWGIVILLLLCFLPSLCMILFASRRMLRNVRSISRILPGEEESPYQLDRIESGIRSLVEQSRSMKEDQLSLRKSRFIRNFLRSDYTALEALRSDAEEAGICVSFGLHMVGVIGSRSEANEDKAFEEIIHFIESREDLDGYGIQLLNTGQRVMALFGGTGEILYEAYGDILAIGKKHCDEFLVAVSRHHHSLLNGSLAYLEANSAYDSRFLLDNDQLIRFSETGQSREMEHFGEMRKRYIAQFENIIRVGSREDVEEAINQMCASLKQENASLLAFRLLYDEILRILMAQWKGSEKDWDQIYNVFTLSRCLTIDDFSELLKEACRMLASRQTDAVNEQSRLADAAIRKMQEGYASPDLTISSLAEELGVSSVTLAVEFKNETGISPSDYLAMIRFNQAKELLKNTDMLVKEISLAVGYEDDHVFIRRFKKETGKTPGQYRKEAAG